MGLRSKQIIIRADADELEHIDTAASLRRMRRAAYIRETVLRSAPPTIPEINRIALSELQRIGGNLNQLSKHANQTGGHDLDITDLRKQCGQLRLVLMGAKP